MDLRLHGLRDSLGQDRCIAPQTRRRHADHAPAVRDAAVELPTFQPDGTATYEGRLIACVDDGPPGRAAARLTASLAVGPGSELLLATVRPSGLRPPLDHDVGRSEVRDARAMLAGAAGDLDPPPELRIAFGEPAERLIALAAREHASLIVVPRPARRPLKTALLGSVHLALAGAAPCPVVLVPPHAEPKPSGPIICGIDGSEPSLAAARVAADLARRLGVRLRLGHVLGVPPINESTVSADGYATWLHSRRERAVRMLQTAVGELRRPPELELLVDHGGLADRLAEIAEREAAQPVVTGSRGRSQAVATLLGSVGSRLATLTTRPCLIVPPTARVAWS
jgi:nucleotide-binding universal stress UspA family protein